MGKDVIIYRDTREKVEKAKYGEKREGGRFGRTEPKVGKKNISKKDFTKDRRVKVYKRAQETAKRASDHQNDAVLKKLNMSNMTMAERKAKILAEIKENRKKKQGEENDEWQDVDEHERDVYATTGYFDVPDEEAMISKHDQ